MKNYLTLASCLKGEEDYIEDFTNLHRYLGVEKFIYFCRDFSKMQEIFKNVSDVQLINFPEQAGNVHHKAWLDACNMTKNHTRWLAMIDADQILTPVSANTIPEVLKKYEQHVALGINWRTFGNNGQDTKLPGSLYERFTKATRLGEGVDNHVQSVVNPLYVSNQLPPNPHMMYMAGGYKYVNTAHRNFPIPFNEDQQHNELFVAHYITKSKEEWENKNKKGRSDIIGSKIPFDQYNTHNSCANAVDEFRVLDLWNNYKNSLK